MKEYLKMSSYFNGNVSFDDNGFICDEKYYRGRTDIAEDYYTAICHAINSHDDLVAEVERLRYENSILSTKLENSERLNSELLSEQ